MIAWTMASLLLMQPKVDTNVVYREVAGEKMMLDFYHPVTAEEGPTPCVIVIHGGSWMSGQRQDMSFLCQNLSKQGLAAATVSYRLAPKNKWPSMIEDVQSATRFLKENAGKYNIDPNRFASSGASAGGHLALLLGLTDNWEKDTTFCKDQSSRVQAVFNIFGPTDLQNDFNVMLTNVVAMQVLGKAATDAKEDMKRLSPITYVAKGAPPVFTVHGRTDGLVPVKQAERLAEAYQKAGSTHQLTIIEDMGHEVDLTRPEVVKAMADGIAFLQLHLASKKGTAAAL